MYPYPDFGVAARYRNATNVHIKQGTARNQIGTSDFMSYDAHMYENQGRRNDLESLGYILWGFAKSVFPWTKFRDEKYAERVYNMKKKLNFQVIC